MDKHWWTFNGKTPHTPDMLFEKMWTFDSEDRGQMVKKAVLNVV